MAAKKSMAMVQTAPRKLERRDLPVPPVTDDSAILRVEACGICGSDYEQYEGVLNTPMPVVPGHEPLGIIEAIGDKAAKRWGVDVGNRVAVETMLACHCCNTCLSGRYHLCGSRKIYSYIPLTEEPGLWGAYSQYMYIAPNAIVHKMSKSLPPELAVMFNPLGAGFRWAVEIPQTQIGDTVVMMGSGPGATSTEATLYTYVDDVDATFERAIAAGGASFERPADQQYGDRRAGVRDPFGNLWWIATSVRDFTRK